jgi:hypothetical protein
MFSILTLFSYFLIAVLLMNMFAKARPKVRGAMPGRKLKTLPMSFGSRFQMQRSSLLALLVGVVFGIATGWLPLSTAAIVGSLALVPLFIPMQYTFTTQGVSLGEGIFYPWKEFSGLSADEKRLQLTNPSLFGNLTLFVQPTEMASVLPVVERYVSKSK